MKTKIKSHDDEGTDFYNKEIPKVASKYTCLTVISWESAPKNDGNYYRQMFWKECKYIKKKVVRHDIDDLSYSSSSDESDESDEE